ncbi:hypothetical protein RBG61_03430 [Paludicola sp. MB14-C6]|uniref:hypothetical protein n=1 Tax=Paludihabitans sp. MB14-C6 TaxID=3070656 RepID=UPI0027DDA690|nr:hypothetical protein [Paludicola sp. MB14-C6]WMJ23726.1 hypothetical protein RBG61_03430 [Paludicola sp. MB14-C6]
MSQMYNGLNEAIATFNGNAEIGELITIASNGVAIKAASDKDIIGVCISKRCELNGIQLRGAVTVNYTGTAPVLGYNNLQTASPTSVKVSASGRAYLVLNVDSTTKQVTILL